MRVTFSPLAPAARLDYLTNYSSKAVNVITDRCESSHICVQLRVRVLRAMNVRDCARDEKRRMWLWPFLFFSYELVPHNSRRATAYATVRSLATAVADDTRELPREKDASPHLSRESLRGELKKSKKKKQKKKESWIPLISRDCDFDIRLSPRYFCVRCASVRLHDERVIITGKGKREDCRGRFDANITLRLERNREIKKKKQKKCDIKNYQSKCERTRENARRRVPMLWREKEELVVSVRGSLTSRSNCTVASPPKRRFPLRYTRPLI